MGQVVSLAAHRSALQTRLEDQIRDERQQAVRALMMQPLLSAGGTTAHDFGLARRHASWLRDWFARNPGWTLTVDGETARLRKTPADTLDSTRPLCDVSGAPFTRRRYVVLCLALAVLERADRQMALGKLADEIVKTSRDDDGLVRIGFDLDLMARDHRRDLVQVVRFLLEIRVLIRVVGDEAQYLEQKGDVLYDVSRPTLSAMLNVRRGPSTVTAQTVDTRIAAIGEELVPDTDDARNRNIRSRLNRKLLDDPVLYYDELSEEERTYLASQRSFLVRQIEVATGLEAEIRAEGIAFVDLPGTMTDLGLPEEGTDGHLALLLAEHLADCARRDGGAVVGRAAIQQHTAALIEQHQSHWRKSVREPGAEVSLTQKTLERLASLRLVRITEDGAVPLPAIGRFAVAAAASSEDES